jgi:hypothetical protein
MLANGWLPMGAIVDMLAQWDILAQGVAHKAICALAAAELRSATAGVGDCCHTFFVFHLMPTWLCRRPVRYQSPLSRNGTSG